MTSFLRLRNAFRLALAGLLVAASVAACATSNKWRLQFSGNAESDGTIVIRVAPPDGQALDARIDVVEGTGENAVARTVVEGLRAQLPDDVYHVERDDGEDVLIKKRFGERNFNVEIVSNTVKGVRINPDRE